MHIEFLLILYPIYRTAEYLEEIAIETAKKLASGELKVIRSSKGLTDKILEFALKYEYVRNLIFQKAKEKVLKMTNGLYPAPLKVS